MANHHKNDPQVFFEVAEQHFTELLVERL